MTIAITIFLTLATLGAVASVSRAGALSKAEAPTAKSVTSIAGYYLLTVLAVDIYAVCRLIFG